MRCFKDQLRQITSYRRSLLETVARESGRQKQTISRRPLAQNGVPIKGVDRIQTGPLALYLETFERGKVGDQIGPYEIFESLTASRDEVEPFWILRPRPTH